MLKNYIKIAYRNLINNKAFSIINIVGLSIGMTATILILLWVQYESSYDGFHKNADNTYMMAIEWPVGDETHKALSTPPPLSEALKKDFPEVINSTRFNGRKISQIDVESGKYKKSLAFADPTLFEIFDLPFISGSINSFNDSEYNILITEDMSSKLFGQEEAIGKTIKIDNEHIFSVAGILKNIPANSYFDYGIFVPFDKIQEIFPREDLTSWGAFRHRTFVHLNKNVDPEKFNSQVYDYLVANGDNNEDKLFLWPMHKLHLYSINGGGKYIYVFIFSLVAILILVLACINFMNLSTARSSLRSREIGLRKLTGAKKINIIIQFFLESILLALFSLLLSVMLVEVLLPAFRNLTGTHLVFDLGNSGIIMFLLGISFFTGIIAGSYPALFLSSFKPVDALKGTSKSGSSIFRKVLVVSQFTISISLIICLLVISSQLTFMNNKELGYSDKNIVLFPLNNQLNDQRELFCTELKRHPAIEEVCFTGSKLGIDASVSTLDTDWEGNDANRSLEIHLLATNSSFLNTYQIEMKEGKFISDDTNLEVAQIVLNETAVNRMRLENPVGKTIKIFENDAIVAGVISDYHFDSLYNGVEPLMIFEAKNWHRYIAVRYNPIEKMKALEHLKKVHKEISPDFPFEIQYLSDMTAKLYKTEKQAKVLFQYFVVLALFISSLGLFGLASFITDRRTKEIGVRKVLGSSVKEVVWLLTSDFSKWVLIANIIAWPVSFLLMKKWLQNFAYRTDISLWHFVIAGFLTLFISLVTISFQTIKAASSDPINALKYE